MYKFSIITVTYNAASCLENSIKSVIDQNYSNIEYIIIDGGSKDGTLDIIKRYSNYISFWISEKDNGIYDAINKGLSHATGDFVLILGSDDLLYEQNILSIISKNIVRPDYIHYGNVKWKGTNQIRCGKFNVFKWGWANIPHQAIFYPRSVYKMFKYDEQYRIYADYAYNLNLIKNGIHFYYIDAIVTNYSIDGFSATNSGKDANFSKDKLKLLYESMGIIPVIVCLIHFVLMKLKAIILHGDFSKKSI